jgi:formate-dependent nitrite reductase membrane component NrfD/ferredoxin
MYRRPDGIVDFDKSICIGCKACMAACPYDAIFINPDDHSAEKCNFCAHRLEVGLEPACVVVCPTQAILIGDLEDPGSKAASMVQRGAASVRRPEKGTRPAVFYMGAHTATLDPLAARQPEGTTFAWAELPGPGQVTSGTPSGAPTSSAAALLSYDVGHSRPWGWRVSLYTWTKGIASGAYLVAIALAFGGRIPWSSPLVRTAGELVSLVFLALTAGLLVADLKHPTRFWMLLARPQWRSWLVRGGVILGAYGGVLVAALAAGMLRSSTAEHGIAFAGVILAVLAAVYTAFLFAQARARDLWQNPLLTPHLGVQALLAGSASMLPIARAIAPRAVEPLGMILAGACAAHVLFIGGETLPDHGTAHTRLAVWQMTRGRYAALFWVGLALTALGVATPAVGWWVCFLPLAGLLAHEHAYVQAGQSVPLA